MKSRVSFLAWMGFGLIFLNSTRAFAAPLEGPPAQPPTPTPSPAQASGVESDWLKPPVLPEHPTQVEEGSLVYYYNCMPCHGDQGQGLTDEFRQKWVKDHQNCWGRGCHAGRVGDGGFPLPRLIPPIFERPDGLSQFSLPENLYAFLHATHPPQRPGALQDDQYWQVTALLLARNGRLAPEQTLGPGATPSTNAAAIAGFFAVYGLVGTALVLQARRSNGDGS
jgi:hypothetical protein